MVKTKTQKKITLTKEIKNLIEEFDKEFEKELFNRYVIEDYKFFDEVDKVKEMMKIEDVVYDKVVNKSKEIPEKFKFNKLKQIKNELNETKIYYLVENRDTKEIFYVEIVKNEYSPHF